MKQNKGGGYARFEPYQRNYMKLAAANGFDSEYIAKKLGLSRVQVSNWLRREKQREEKASEQKAFAEDPSCAKDGDHICWGCFRATNPAVLLNSCSWSAIGSDGDLRFERPSGARCDSRGNIVECPLFLPDSVGFAQYGRQKEDIAETISLCGSAIKLL